MTKPKWDSVFLSNLHYFYAKTDGTYEFPNSKDGDLLKQKRKSKRFIHRKTFMKLFVELSKKRLKDEYLNRLLCISHIQRWKPLIARSVTFR